MGITALSRGDSVKAPVLYDRSKEGVTTQRNEHFLVSRKGGAIISSVKATTEHISRLSGSLVAVALQIPASEIHPGFAQVIILF